MTLTQLEYVIAVDDFGSFSRAAEKCFVTQPTLSMQIQKLEDELSVQIFDRTKKPIKTTPIGQEIIEQARQNVQGMERIRELVTEHNREIKGHLRVGIIPTLAPYLLPLFLTSFIQKYPQVHVSIEEYISEQIIQKLKQNWLDVGILVTPLDDPSITEIPLFYEQFHAYISTHHPLTHQHIIELENLDIDDMLLLSEGHCFREQVVNICPDKQRHDWKAQIRFESGSLETLKRIIEQDYGYTLLPELALQNITVENKKYIKELSDPKPIREVSLILHRGILKRNLIEALREHILASIPEPLKDKNRGNIVNWV
jgi:LysR family hydrogen peroxide-inducible transcriptional activator